MASIHFKNITKKYGKVTAIEHLNLEIRDKEFMVLVGPSGCGKSTLLRMIAGLEEIDEGELLIDNQLVNHIAPKDRDIAIVFQNYALYPHMTVFENLAFGLKIRGMDKKIIQEKVGQVAKTLEIENLLTRKPKDMSGGQRQRVAIGRAIVRNPKVFLFDEPLSNLDAKLRTQMRVEIASLHKQLQTTVVYVTHDQVEAMTLGDRIVVLNKGEISQIGTPKELYARPANLFVAGFIGSPAMNFIAGKIVVSKGKSLFIDTSNQIQLPLPSLKIEAVETEVLLGIRPEHILIQSKTNETIGFETTIHHIERTGFEQFLFTSAYGHSLTIRSHGLEEIEENGKVHCSFDFKNIHIFDKDNGKRIESV